MPIHSELQVVRRTLNHKSKLLKPQMNSIFSLFLDQVKQIREGGLQVFSRKLYVFILAIPVLSAVLLMRLLLPILIVRFRKLDSSRIGALYYADWYLAEKSAGLHKKRYIDIFNFIPSLGSIANHQFVKMYKRVLPFSFSGKFAHMTDKVNSCFAGYEAHIIPAPDIRPRYNVPYNENELLKYVLNYKEPFISFTKKEEMWGQKALYELGIPDKKPFICFHARDCDYLNTIFPDRNWSYQDYRDSNIHHYIPAVEKLVEQGYYAMRMGAIVKDKLTQTKSGIIDYATNGKRTDFMDIFLGAKCHFFICSEVGLSIVPEVFRRPIVYVNWCVLGRMPLFVHHALLIPKKLYLRKECRFLTFREIIKTRIGYFGYGEEFEEAGIDLIENDSKEIMDVVTEIEARLKGTWQTRQEDEELQERFWTLFEPSRFKNVKLRIGTEFLRQNQKLLN